VVKLDCVAEKMECCYLGLWNRDNEMCLPWIV